jgi:hypothetical protein
VDRRSRSSWALLHGAGRISSSWTSLPISKLLDLLFLLDMAYHFTSSLDRESLAALIAALKTFEGGVLVITHNQEVSSRESIQITQSR